jgi:type I restriction enzyme, R subunit
MNKKNLTERDIGTKFLTPAVKDAGWDVISRSRQNEWQHLFDNRE